ncbi:MAG: DUF58 domain-containing protein, partial [Caldilineaceae bacterium]|nr:DUF58 domain-containing protein [Caldilineaceae bacterium]
MITNLSLKNLSLGLDALWNRGVTSDAHITLTLRWPLLFIPLVLINQLLTPHPVWVAILVTLLGIYALAWFWVHTQADWVRVERRRDETLLVAGDLLHERFVLINDSSLPLLWAEFRDMSELPGYTSSQVVASSAHSSYTWQSSLECRRRGVYQLGPAQLVWSDPFGFFTVEKQLPQTETILIYPRVAQMPEFHLPQSATSGNRQRQRPLLGAIRSTSVRDYRPGDSLRHVHWRSTAHRNSLMVTELDMEPGGEVWIVLDLNEAAHSTAQEVTLSDAGETDTLEYSIVVAASLAAQILGRHDRTAVGLIVASHPSRIQPGASDETHFPASIDTMVDEHSSLANGAPVQMVVVAPQIGQAQLWRILAALAPVQPAQLSLAQLLRSNREQLGRGRRVVLITPHVLTAAQMRSAPQVSFTHAAAGAERSSSPPAPPAAVRLDPDDAQAADDNWVAELVHVENQVAGNVFLIAADEENGDGAESAAVPRTSMGRALDREPETRPPRGDA